ncbi:MAG: hypothetical protein ABSF91_13460 [Bacteroidota bacterium]|jgi:hypothetical protein
MKTAGIVLFTLDLLATLCTGYTNVTKEKVVDLEDLETAEENQRTVNWIPYVGIGMMVIGGAFLVLGRNKSLTSRYE